MEILLYFRKVLYKVCNLLRCSHSEFYPVVYTRISVYSTESRPTFWQNISPPSSLLKCKPNKKPAVSKLTHSSTLNMEEICNSEKSVDFHRCYVPYSRTPYHGGIQIVFDSSFCLVQSRSLDSMCSQR
jgi:hypothetical protein